MSWLLDADVLSQPAKKRGNARVVAWLEAQKHNCYTSSIVIAQLAFWIRSKQSKQRDALQVWLRRLLDAMVLATGNDQDFRHPGVRVFNPFKDLA